jgi:hypothetical protein
LRNRFCAVAIPYRENYSPFYSVIPTTIPLRNEYPIDFSLLYDETTNRPHTISRLVATLDMAGLSVNRSRIEPNIFGEFPWEVCSIGSIPNGRRGKLFQVHPL